MGKISEYIYKKESKNIYNKNKMKNTDIIKGWGSRNIENSKRNQRERVSRKRREITRR